MENEEIFQQNELAAQNVAMHSQANQLSHQTAMQQYYVEEREKGLAEAQLEVEATLAKIYHMLKQDIYRSPDGLKFKWIEIKDSSKRILTEEGVERIMQLMSFFVNKENLLSNFSEEQINDTMVTFRNALNANMYMKYEVFFRQPTIDECKKILDLKIKEKMEIRKIADELLGKIHDAKLAKKEIISFVEQKIAKEIDKIKKQKTKENLKEWELMFEQLSQIVFATLNRAWKGEERGSLRRHMTVSEMVGNPSLNKQDNKKWKIWG